MVTSIADIQFLNDQRRNHECEWTSNHLVPGCALDSARAYPLLSERFDTLNVNRSRLMEQMDSCACSVMSASVQWLQGALRAVMCRLCL